MTPIIFIQTIFELVFEYLIIQLLTNIVLKWNLDCSYLELPLFIKIPSDKRIWFRRKGINFVDFSTVLRFATFLRSKRPYNIPDDRTREKPVSTKNVNGISSSPVNLSSSYSPVRKNKQGYFCSVLYRCQSTSFYRYYLQKMTSSLGIEITNFET